MYSSRHQISDLIRQGCIGPDDTERALRLAGIRPERDRWITFFDRLLLWTGGLCLCFALMFFMAYNWEDMGRFARFALAEACLILSVIAYWKISAEKLAAKVALFMSCLFLGILLALYGQTYQTGADPWQLFFNWAVLILPWVFLSRFAALWIFWLLLINLSMVLYHQTFRGLFGFVLSAETDVLWWLVLLNGIFHIGWEFCSSRWPCINERWAARLLAAASGVPLSLLCLQAIFDSSVTANGLAALLWFAWMGCILIFYRRIKPDLFMLAAACLSGIVIVVSYLSKYILDDADPGGFLFIALVILGLGTGTAVWLRNIHREWLS